MPRGDTGAVAADHYPIEIIDDETQTTWRFDQDFLASNWTCIWGRGCQGILEHSATELHQGCCSLGAELDDDEARNVAALAAVIDPGRFQFSEAATDGSVFSHDSSDANGWRTRVVDGACIFFNRPGFDGGAGCALHLEAVAADEPIIEWKPSVCWQLPVHIDWVPRSDGGEVATVRRWSRSDWGEHGESMAWLCTEADDAFVGDEPVVESLATELEAMVGSTVYVELKGRLR